jgi:hypothetical protein
MTKPERDRTVNPKPRRLTRRNRPNNRLGALVHVNMLHRDLLLRCLPPQAGKSLQLFVEQTEKADCTLHIAYARCILPFEPLPHAAYWISTRLVFGGSACGMSLSERLASYR